MALFVSRNGQLQTLKGIYQNIRIEPEVHVNFNGGMPFRSYVSDVKYTRDIDRRFKSNRTPVDKSTNNQDFPVWCWTELNEDETETLYIGCKHFYVGESKLFVHFTNANNTTGLFRYFKGTNLDFCKEWDATYITTLYCSFRDTQITDFSGIQDWNMPNLTIMRQMASQLPDSLDFRPFLKWTIGHNAPTTYAMYYGNQRTYNDWSPMCSNYYWKLANNNVHATMSYLPYCYYLDMTNWDLTEWNLDGHNLFSHSAGALKIKTPILPLTVKPMKLPYAYYDMDTEQAYTEIPLNLDRQLTLYKGKSDFGK